MGCCKQGDREEREPPREEREPSSGCCRSEKETAPSHHTECCSSYDAYEEDEQAHGGCCRGHHDHSHDEPCEEEAPEHVDAQMSIQELLSNFPAHSQRLAQELTLLGLQCVGCQASVYETIESGMKRHGMDNAAINRLVDKLNSILQEHSDPNTITLTPRAAKKYLAILEAEGKEGWGLRFGDRPAGCSGFEYVLDYSEKASPEDVVFVSEGIEIHIHPSAVTRLKGALIDYVDGLHASGFKISNSHARSACACGSSHNY